MASKHEVLLSVLRDLTQAPPTVTDDSTNNNSHQVTVVGAVQIVQQEGMGGGVVTSQPLETGSTIYSLPERMMMPVERVQASPLGCLLQENNVFLFSSHSWLALFLVAYPLEMSNTIESSLSVGVPEPLQPLWKAYIDALPTVGDFDSSPLFYTTEQKLLLGNSVLKPMIERVESTLSMDYMLLSDKVPWFAEHVSKDLWLWARLCILSRVFTYETAEGLCTEALVPFADMLNHKHPGNNVEWSFDTKINGFVMTTQHGTLAANSPLFDSYGSSECNSVFLLYYGFTIAKNPFNCARVQCVMDFECAFAMEKMQLGNLSQTFKITTQLTAEETKECFSYCRFSICQDEHVFETLKVSYGAQRQFLPATSITDELEVLKMLSEGCVNAKEKLPEYKQSSLQPAIEDTEEEDVNSRTCKQMVLNEIAVLDFWIDITQLVFNLYTQGMNTKFMRAYDDYCTVHATPAHPDTVAFLQHLDAVVQGTTGIK